MEAMARGKFSSAGFNIRIEKGSGILAVKTYQKYSIAAVLLGLALWFIGATFGKAFLRAAFPERPSATLETTWTPAARHELFNDVRAKTKDLKYLVDDAGRDELAKCWVSKYTTLFPGGPASVDTVARSDKALLRASAESVSKECAQAYSETVRKSSTWNARATAVYLESCVSSEGEESRSWCKCLASNANHFFDTPAAYGAALDDTNADGAEAKLQELARICPHGPDRPEPQQ
jgi:hypothetical protein